MPMYMYICMYVTIVCIMYSSPMDSLGMGWRSSFTSHRNRPQEDEAPDGLTQVTVRAVERSGRLNITGRYHRLPKRMEDDYETRLNACSLKILLMGFKLPNCSGMCQETNFPESC